MRATPWRVAGSITAALFLLDLVIPDFIPVVGYADDAAVIAWVLLRPTISLDTPLGHTAP